MYLNTKYIFQLYLNTNHKIHLKYLNTSVGTSVNVHLRRLRFQCISLGFSSVLS